MALAHQLWITFLYFAKILIENFQIISNENKKTVRYSQETIKFRTP